MAQSTTATRSPTEKIGDEAAATAKDLGETGAVLAEQAAAVAQSAREALAEMREIVERFAAATGDRAGEAVDAVKATGAETAGRVAGLVDDARTLGRDGLDGLADTVAKRPISSLAVAAGIGLLLGLVTQAGGRR